VIRDKIINSLQGATDIVISHYHGDHIPLAQANPYQLGLSQIRDLRPDLRVWAMGLSDLQANMQARAKALALFLGFDPPAVEGRVFGPLSFSRPVAHGVPNSPLGQVMMTRIEDQGRVFVHASDIQLLDNKAVSQIIDWEPDIVLASGPPLYLGRLSKGREKRAWGNALALSKAVKTLILDHHLLRCERGVAWLEELGRSTGQQVLCAADFMGQPRLLLEAWREQLYRDQPVKRRWHRDYAQGRAGLEQYRSWAGYSV
jgi:hypothetical protein